MAMTIIPAMVSIYADLIVVGARTLETIPAIYRKPVEDYMNAQKKG